jgi:glycosyltransferase involved in cell wall biosynthesis
MKIAIMGIRGIPANYGGFETFIEKLAPRLVRNGHSVTVYGRSNIIDYNKEFYKGVRIKRLPTISHKYLDTVAHTAVCTIFSFFTRYDLVFVCNSANAIFCFLPRLWGKPCVLNVDGLEWKRQKWNWLGKAFYRISEFIATFSATALVSDALEVQKYYQKKFNQETVYIPYGAPEKSLNTTETLDRFKLLPKEYILYVSRLEPENNAHLVVKAFEKVKTHKKLVMVGDAPYNQKYIQELKQTKDPRIIFTGYVFGKGYAELQSHAYVYVQATEVGGTHPALLEGMGFGNCVLANDVPEHREVLGSDGFYFNGKQDENLKTKLEYLVDHPQIVSEYRQKTVSRVRKTYSWDKITRDYEKLFYKIARTR